MQNVPTAHKFVCFDHALSPSDVSGSPRKLRGRVWGRDGAEGNISAGQRHGRGSTAHAHARRSGLTLRSLALVAASTSSSVVLATVNLGQARGRVVMLEA